MTRFLGVALLQLGFLIVMMVMMACPPSGLILEAQTVPAVKHAVWNPNPTADNVTQYKLVLDGGTQQTVPLTACTATLCSVMFTIPTFGAHSLSVFAQNLSLSTDPTSLQDSAPATVAFTLNAAAKTPAGATITN